MGRYAAWLLRRHRQRYLGMVEVTLLVVALSTPRPRMAKRGALDLKGKSDKVAVHAVQGARRAVPG